MDMAIPTHKALDGASGLTRQQYGYQRAIGIRDDLLDRDIGAVGISFPFLLLKTAGDDHTLPHWLVADLDTEL